MAVGAAAQQRVMACIVRCEIALLDTTTFFSLRKCIFRCKHTFLGTKMHVFEFLPTLNICQTLFSTLAGAAAQ
jgi:hypothetical protein